LASASPRRKALLQQIGLSFTCQAANIEEDIFSPGQPSEIVTYLAQKKAEAVSRSVEDRQALVIAADTIVVLEGKILNKPRNDADAYTMLSLLNGTRHEVYTGVCVADLKHNLLHVDYERTYVYFRNLQDREIRAYIACGEGQDKAGAYGIQGIGALLVEKIEGSYSNVVGLPLNKLYSLLKDCGLELLGG